jgi:glycosyltransferase involved in cell wall biosynthesis
MLHVGDAVGQHTVAVCRLLRAAGVESEIYVEREDPETGSLTRPASAYPEVASSSDLLVYQFATESVLVPWLVARPEPLVLNYHNVTPPESFAPWDNALARAQLRAQNQLRLLAGRASLGVAVSEFNRADLVAAGFGATVAVPPVLSSVVLDLLDAPDAPAGSPSGVPGPGVSTGAASSEGSRWLMVGRLAPNKAVEDVIDALFIYRKLHDAGATLTVVGKPAVAAYAAALLDQVAELGLLDAVRFAGRVDDARLGAEYRGADVLVVASEHEGFCLPVVEAMAHGLPVVAYRQGALPEVLGTAGLLVDDKDPATLARAVHRVCSERGLRDEMIVAGRRRLPELKLADAGDRLVSLLLSTRSGGPPSARGSGGTR